MSAAAARLAVVVLCTLATLVPVVLPAQAVRGRVVAADEGGQPARGAVVSLLAPDGRRVAPALVGEDGAYVVTAPGPGLYRARVDLIGYEAWLSAPIRLAAGQTLTLDVRLPLRRVRLAAVTVEGASRCRARADQGPHAVALWEEIRRALTLTELSREHRLPFELRVAQRLVTARGPLGTPERAMVRTELVRPWLTPPPAVLAEEGWVRWEGDSITFHGPGIDALLSEEFESTHCFTPASRETPGGPQVGLAFEPTPGRTLPDVAGTIWLDAGTSELRVVEFTFANTADSLSNGEPAGGALEFARLPSGLRYISRWTLRLPATVGLPDISAASVEGRPQHDPSRWEVEPYVERVGEAVLLRREDRPGERGVAVVAGTVIDSTTGGPLPGVRVLVPGEPVARTDSAGRFAVEVQGVPADSTEYVVAFQHPRFDALWLPGTERPVRLRAGGTTTVDFTVPSLATLMATVCPAPPPADAGAGRYGLATGRLRTATGEPMPDSTHILVEWTESGGQAPAPAPVVRVRPDNRFVVCPLSLERPVVVRVQQGGRDVAAERFLVPPDGVGHVELVLGASLPDDVLAAAAAPVAVDDSVTLAGFVRDTAGRALSGAEVRSGDRLALTGSDGAFTLTGLRGDTVDLFVRRIGYVPAAVELAVMPGTRVELAVRLVPTALELGTIVVEGRVLSTQLMQNGFYDRQRLGVGTQFGPEDLEGYSATLASLVREAPGASVTTDMSGRSLATGRHAGAACPLSVFVDGVEVRWAADVGLEQLVARQDILAIEVYPRVSQVPRALTGLRSTQVTGLGLPSPVENATTAPTRTGFGGMPPEALPMPAVNDGAVDCGALLLWTKPMSQKP